MATLAVPITLLPGMATFPDGSTNNLLPGMTKRKGTQASANGDPFIQTLDFDASQREQVWYTFPVPANFASAPTLLIVWGANATTGNVVWGCRVQAQTPGDTDTPYSRAMATAQTATAAVLGTTARRETSTSIAITNTDSMAAGDMLTIQIYRDGANGSDTCSVDAEVQYFVFDCTTT